MKQLLSERIEKYSVMAAAGAAATVGLSASATIIASGPQNIVINTGDPLLNIDMDGDGATDVNFAVGTFGAANTPFLYAGAAFLGDGPAVYTSASNFPYASNLALGDTIDASRSFNVGSSTTAGPVLGAGTMVYGSFGAFAAPSTGGYLGYTFFAGNGVGQVFAWIEVANVSTTQMTVVQWGYEDAGTGIDAGAVPEPGSLALLALGAVGVMSRRDRKAVRDAN
ncbi:PEP-CTERM sorting domain-containing protein [Phycisphaeraceae bacterium D3-23]